MAYGSYLNEDEDPYDPYSGYYSQPAAPAPATAPYFGAGLGPSAPAGSVPFTGQSQGNQDASLAAGNPNNLPVNQPAAGTGYTGQKDLGSLWAYWRSTHTVAAPDMAGFAKFLSANGMTATQATHAGGLASDDKLIVNGKMLDFGTSLGAANGQFFDNPSPVGDDGGGAGVPALADGSLVAPYTKAQPQIGLPGAFDFAPYQLPNAQEVLSRPGYQFRFDEGMRGVQGLRASQGLLRTGGTLKDLVRYGQGFASNEYGNTVNQDLAAYNTNYGVARDKYNFNEVQPNTMAYDRGLTGWLNDRDTYWRNQDNAFSRPYQMAQLGLNASTAS